jgi:hypothetical protein
MTVDFQPCKGRDRDVAVSHEGRCVR